MQPAILVVDDHPLVAEALRLRILAMLPRANVVTVWTFDAAVEQIACHRRLSLILLDLMLPDAAGYSGLLLLRQLARSTPIAMISSRQDTEIVAKARSLGAAGFLSKSLPPVEFSSAINSLLQGQSSFPNAVNEPSYVPVLDDQAKEQTVGTLSAAQLRVLLSIADGRLNKQVAQQIGVAEVTVKSHMTTIFRKLGISTRIEAISFARSLLALPTHYPV